VSTPATTLKDLPKPKEPIVVGLYKFRDQTGQYKASENGSNFSTAVTQGATSILIKTLEDSKWFVPIERENIGNLLQERNLRSTRIYKDADPSVLKFTIICWNIDEGLAIRVVLVLGILVGAIKYRQDRVTIYLRMVSTSNGKILKSVYFQKQYSQAIDQSL
jgi:curli production assembly/transport component CsgG